MVSRKKTIGLYFGQGGDTGYTTQQICISERVMSVPLNRCVCLKGSGYTIQQMDDLEPVS